MIYKRPSPIVEILEEQPHTPKPPVKKPAKRKRSTARTKTPEEPSIRYLPPELKVVSIVDAPPNIALGEVREDPAKLRKPDLNDAVKVGLYDHKKFAENVWLRVTKVGNSICEGKITGCVLFPADHGLDIGSKVQFTKVNVLKHVENPKWVAGNWYEA